MAVTRPLRWLGGTVIKTPPIGEKGRRNLGAALRILQKGGQLTMPVSRPMPSIGARCHELRVDVFRKTTQKTPKNVIERCRRRPRGYEEGQ